MNSKTVSKSIISNNVLHTYSRSLVSPIAKTNITSSATGYTGDLDMITQPYINILNYIETNYLANMSNKQYALIPTDYNQYVQLYIVLQQLVTIVKNSKLILLLNMIQNGLVGAIQSFSLYGQVNSLQIDKTNLEKKIDEIISNKNVRLVDMSNTSGQMTIKKKIRLAAVFNYYIIIYGMPAFGVGFDPDKIAYLANVLKSRGINPYR